MHRDFPRSAIPPQRQGVILMGELPRRTMARPTPSIMPMEPPIGRRYQRDAGMANTSGKAAKKEHKQQRHERHVRLRQSFLKLPAWRALDMNARAVWAELQIRYNGSNNGKISASVRSIGEAVPLNKDSVSRALQELQAKGFIRIARHGSYGADGGHAALITLTDVPTESGVAPTRDFESWSEGNDLTVKVNQRQRHSGLCSAAQN
jgi:hypothetical protein